MPERVFLHVESVLHIRGATAEHLKPWSRLRSNEAHHEVRSHSADVRQREKHIVVRLETTAEVELRIDGGHRSEEYQRLIDEVRSDVVQQPARLARIALLPPTSLGCRTPTLESRLEAIHASERAVRRQAPNGEEVAV